MDDSDSGVKERHWDDAHELVGFALLCVLLGLAAGLLGPCVGAAVTP